MHNHRVTIVDENLFTEVKVKVKQMDQFIRSNVKCHPAKLLNVSKYEYKMNLQAPTPEFFWNLTTVYVTFIKDINYTLYYQLKQF